MLEKFTHVKNPLTVVALFAGFAEVSGTLILPLIEKDTQSTYVWFLMGFPVLLILLFFAILNWNHTVLYAPSDFQNEDNFARFTKASVLAIVSKEIDEQHEAEALPDAAPEHEDPGGRAFHEDREDYLGEASGTGSEPTSLSDPMLSQDEQRWRNRMATEQGLSNLERREGRFFLRSVALPDMPQVVFDGVDPAPDRFTVAEVKYSHTGFLASKFIQATFDRAKDLYKVVGPEEQANFTFHMVYVIGDTTPESSASALYSRTRVISLRYPFRSVVHVFRWSSL
ncbi:hypothetical protein [Rhizobium leguminosarum]|uniref:hypothetical protein n=1 Tax=Rhizobium leguminosarum TaxID=384 RepID=UPI0016166F18|nr:hypothetical protein [Rhizobium leguminosarum]MBB4345201.1 hypothetical protein [Rhizobium leguminosarum]MBB6298272.1 hypothetical protein [Rhizobium leguminosarum]